ncbi:MAG: cation:proton antiporter [Deltaproteobacteria bacterium]|nr:cation:proton antiporter [Deltaproteobacteria bacterium]
MAETVLIIMALLATGFLGTRVARIVRLPHSVFLVMTGVVAGLVFRHAGWGQMDRLAAQFPDIILYVLLPPLVFESAYNLPLSDLKKDFAPIGALAVLALITSTAVVGILMHLALGLPLVPSLTFGALISATDPVAVVALFREIGAPKRLSTIVEGESLLNDGTAIVLFRVLVAAAAAPALDAGLFARGAIEFVEVSLGGVVVGLVTAWLMEVLLNATSRSTSAQLGLTVAAAYGSFLIADHFLHVSGVISTLTVGLHLGTRARLELNKEALHGMHHIWEFLSLAANTLVFFAVGVTVDPAVMAGSLKYIPATVAIAYLARAVSVFTTIPPVNALRLAAPVGFAYQTILLWGGLRGGLALGLVLLLPDGFPHKQTFLAVATAVVLSTLFINALTIRGVMRLLKLDRLDPDDERFYGRTIRLLRESLLAPMVRASETGGISGAIVEHHRGAESEGHDGGGERDVHFAVNSFLLTERGYYDDKIEDGILSRKAYVQLVESVADRLEAFDRRGIGGLRGWRLERRHESYWARIISRLLPAGHHARIARLTVGLEVLLHRRLAVEEALKGVDDPEVKAIGKEELSRTIAQLSDFHRMYPDHATAVQSLFLANTMNAGAEKAAQRLFDAGIISAAVCARAREHIEAGHDRAVEEARAYLNPTTLHLLSRVPLFLRLPGAVRERLAANARRVPADPGRPVVSEGEPGSSFFLVTAGVIEVSGSRLREAEHKPRLFAGDFFGELSLLFGSPRNATVTPVVASELLEIDRHGFDDMTREHPEIVAEIRATAAKRVAEDNLPPPPPPIDFCPRAS